MNHVSRKNWRPSDAPSSIPSGHPGGGRRVPPWMNLEEILIAILVGLCEGDVR